MFIIRFSLLFTLFFAAIANAISPYQHFILKIEEDGSAIMLENGFTWHTRSSSLFGDNRKEKIKDWKVGDEIALCFLDIGERKRKIIFSLKNLCTDSSVQVRYLEQMNEWHSHEIDAIISKGYEAILTDGSRWKVGWYDSFVLWNWKKGERVMIYQDACDADSYVLVNPDYGLQRNCRWFGCWSQYSFSCVDAILQVSPVLE